MIDHDSFSLNACITMMRESPAVNHPFLRRIESEGLTAWQWRLFGIQWYKTARAHKEAFPWLVANTQDDDVRFDLIEILREEYGSGDRRRIHARLLWKFLSAIGLELAQVDEVAPIDSVRRFSGRVLASWKDSDPVSAFGLHFCLEFTASAFHVAFANGVRDWAGVSESDREYFEFHREAEKRHSDVSVLGWRTYGQLPDGPPRLMSGVALGIDLLNDLWTGFDENLSERAGG